MEQNKNSIKELDDLIAYVDYYGYAAFGYALLDMFCHNKIHITKEQTDTLWEYRGYIEED